MAKKKIKPLPTPEALKQWNLTPESNSIERLIFAALDRLKLHDGVLLDILSERMMYDGGIEKVFQGMFLWAFNTIRGTDQFLWPEVCDHDFVAIGSDPAVNDLAADEFKKSDIRWHQNASAVIEVKDTDNLGEQFRKDLRKLQKAGENSGKGSAQRLLYEVVLLKTWSRERLEAGWAETEERDVTCSLHQFGVLSSAVRIGSTLLFEHKQSPSSPDVLTYLSVLVFSLTFAADAISNQLH